MKFVVSSVDLLHHLQNVSRVISSKNTLPILDNVLFKLDGNTLELTASDLESTFITSMDIENASDSGSIAIPARLLLDTLKEFPDQPLTFDINPEDLKIVMSSENGQYDLPGQNGDDFPQLPVVKDENKASFQLGADVLMSGINNTLFATADDELRPVMNGIFLELATNEITFVASDAHKLVRYKRSDAKSDSDSSFILPKKTSFAAKKYSTKRGR
jgi:DNA polymerase-3 subunit beta